jgi:hypothetical protein
MASAETSRFLISSYHSLNTRDVALDVIGRWLVQLFQHTNTDDFSYSLWKAESDTGPPAFKPRAESTPSTLRNREEELIHREETTLF